MPEVSNEKATPFYQYLNKRTYDGSNKVETAKTFKKGEMTGRFEMGSTIVLIYECDKETTQKVEPGMKLSLGQEIVAHK